ncbi:MAG: CocE/NonD family hydrolase [Candidatus Thermoplasmatota archaeon]
MILTTLFSSGCIKPTSYMVEMRDGVHLATDVYVRRTQRNEPHGSILIRTPYNKQSLGMFGSLVALKGWPMIIQDVRGRFNSEGKDTVFKNDHYDGYDTLLWISNQTWSNKKIATFGGSALGIIQYLMAGENPPSLACQYIQVATPDLYKHAIYPGGQFQKALVEGWLNSQGSGYIIPELLAHENYTLDYWTNVSLADNWQDINVPAIHIGGWYDCFTQGTIDGFMGYQYYGGSGAQGKSKLIVGPWTHSGSYSRIQGELRYPPNAIDTFSAELFWNMTKMYTMGKNTGFENWPAVTYYVMGDVTNTSAPGNEWRFSDIWPIPATQHTWYLHGDGTLKQQPPGDAPPKTYQYNPTNPVPTRGGRNLNLPAGPYDQREVEQRDDVLVFTSPVLDQPYEVTGPIQAKLFVSSDCPDTDFTVKLTDVYPDGRSMLITDGILRMRNRHGFDHWEFMQPGEIYEITVDLWSISYIWNTGHQIRIAISSSNYPRFLANPNTNDAIYQNTTYRIAENTLYIDTAHPSCIIVPYVSEQNYTVYTPPSPQHRNLFSSLSKQYTQTTWR